METAAGALERAAGGEFFWAPGTPKFKRKRKHASRLTQSRSTATLGFLTRTRTPHHHARFPESYARSYVLVFMLVFVRRNY